MKEILGTALVIVIIAVCLFFAVRYMLRQKRAGRCAGCPYNTTCKRGECDRK